jgi:chromosome segregation ATPase
MPTKQQLQDANKALNATISTLQKGSDKNGMYTHGLLAEITQKDEQLRNLHNLFDARDKELNEALESAQQEILERKAYIENKNLRIEELQAKLKQWENELNAALRDNTQLREIAKQVSAHHYSQLMSVWYMLDTLATCGTHREKATVITHLKAVIEKLSKGRDSLSLFIEKDNPLDI